MQRTITARHKQVLHVGDKVFKDLNGNGVLDPYEDWRLDSLTRAKDLVGKMTLKEKVGMMMIDTLNAQWGGVVGDEAHQMVESEHMRRFIFRNGINLKPVRIVQNSFQKYTGETVSPKQTSLFLNGVQELCESSRLGIPALFKSNARNHEEIDARYGININAGCFSAWPKEAGLAALRNNEILVRFAEAMKTEWRTIGIRGMYGYMVDLATEPRWNRVHETFTEDAHLCSDIIRTLVEVLQGSSLNENSIALTVKHFFGGGPQENGMDPHYPFGKNQVYPTDNLAYHLMPFKAAIDAGVSSIMPYYGIPVGIHTRYRPAPDVIFDEDIGIGIGFNKGIVTDLLRKELGFKGNVNSDTAIITLRPWGVENYSTEQLLAISINAGIDVLSGFHTVSTLMDVVGKNYITTTKNSYNIKGVSLDRLDEAVTRLLVELFDLGLFENPYVDADITDEVFQSTERQKEALLAQSKSVVVLTNNGILIQPSKAKVFLANVDSKVAHDHGYEVVTKADEADFVIIKILIRNIIRPVVDAEGKPMFYPNGKEVDTQYGGPIWQEAGNLSISSMKDSSSWSMTPRYEELQEIFASVDKDRCIVFLNFRQPYVIDDACGLKDVGALCAIYGVSDEAIFNIIDGSVKPEGKLPFSLPATLEAVAKNLSDKPGYEEGDTYFDFGYSYP